MRERTKLERLRDFHDETMDRAHGRVHGDPDATHIPLLLSYQNTILKAILTELRWANDQRGGGDE